MPLNLVLRTLNEEFLLETFFHHYQELGVNHIYVFDSGSNDNTLEIIDRWTSETPLVSLVLSDSKYRHSNYQQQTMSNNRILDWVIDHSDVSTENTYWLFPDIDEFLNDTSFQPLLNSLNQDKQHPVIRTVFIDWYLSPAQFHSSLSPKQILHLIHERTLKGKISDLWGDPFYKDYILNISKENFPLIRRLRTVSGFHRLILDDHIHIPSNEPYALVNHMRILPEEIFRHRLDLYLQTVIDSKDDWSFVHFTRLKSLIENYNSVYPQLELKSFAELMEEIESFKLFDNTQSFYNNVIMQENLRFSTGSRPSMHNIQP